MNKKEFEKCKNEPIYFIEKYIKIKHPRVGLTNFILNGRQVDLILDIHNGNKDVYKEYVRQIGKSTAVLAYFLHYCIFNYDKTLVISSPKLLQTRAHIDTLITMYENLPDTVIAPSIFSYNKTSIEFDNGNRILGKSYDINDLRGLTTSINYFDEFNFMNQEKLQQTIKTLSVFDDLQLIRVSS